MKKLIASLAVAFGLVFSHAAFAQGVTLPQIQAIGQNDLVQVIPNGQPSAQSVFSTAGGIGGVEEYAYRVPLTAFAITVPNAVSLLYLNPAGMLATGALTMEATPSDGQRFCLEDTQTQTAITISAGTGSTMLTAIGLGALTALVANTRYCWFYNAPLAGWIRTL